MYMTAIPPIADPSTVEANKPTLPVFPERGGLTEILSLLSTGATPPPVRVLIFFNNYDRLKGSIPVP